MRIFRCLLTRRAFTFSSSPLEAERQWTDALQTGPAFILMLDSRAGSFRLFSCGNQQFAVSLQFARKIIMCSALRRHQIRRLQNCLRAHTALLVPKENGGFLFRTLILEKPRVTSCASVYHFASSMHLCWLSAWKKRGQYATKDTNESAVSQLTFIRKHHIL